MEYPKAKVAQEGWELFEMEMAAFNDDIWIGNLTKCPILDHHYHQPTFCRTCLSLIIVYDTNQWVYFKEWKNVQKDLDFKWTVLISNV